MRAHPLLAFLLLSVLFTYCYAADCTDKDYIHEYTQCKQPSNTHSLVYYKDPTSACTSGYTLPPPVLGIACNVSCRDGQYIGLGDSFCTNCSSGTYSKGGGIYVDTWNVWPSTLTVKTYCVRSGSTQLLNCSGWQLDDFSVRSGPLNASQTSVLEFGVILATDGRVRFSYLVDAEAKYDGLYFYVDDIYQLGLISSTPTFTEFSTSLKAGFHTLKFSYYKDGSVDVGADAAFVQILDIDGVYEAWDAVCVQCDVGSYAPSTGTSDCVRCPSNTISTSPGASDCAKCDQDKYAFPGSDECTPKRNCTANDYETLRTACDSNVQRLVSSWLQPRICEGGVALPAPQVVPCLDCDPGFFRSTNYECTPCTAGSIPDSTGSSCSRCPSGTAAVKQLTLTKFDGWQDFASTGCSGDCGTTGWRMRSSFIDAGVGHGAQVESWFELDVDLNAAGTVFFSHYLQCVQQCKLTFSDPLSSAAQVFGEGKGMVNVSIPVSKGAHRFRWTFLKFSTSGSSGRTDTAIIYNITITNADQGGAPACVACPSGSISSQGSTSCSNCTAGFTSNAAASACVPCSGNEFNDEEGGECRPCLPGTYPNANRTGCDNPCFFSTKDVISGKNVTYDLRPLSQDGRTLGPYPDQWFEYSINVCNIGGFDPTCHTDDPEPLMAHICQYDTHVEYAINLGVYAGYYPLAINTTGQRGVVIEYSGGSEGCEPFYGYKKKRSATVKFLCDPEVEVGDFRTDNITTKVFESPKCHYNFIVRSQYACPICSEADYSFYYSPCNNNQRLKIFYWLDSKTLCYGGPRLPQPVPVECSASTLQCGPGQYIDETSGTAVCAVCKAGTYSVGGGTLVNSWEPITGSALPTPFISYCSGAGCSGWADSGYSIQSGNGISTLAATYDLVVEGSISFKYKIYSTAGVFSFVVNGAEKGLNTAGSSSFDWTPITIDPLPPGRHQFLWKFTGGKRNSPSGGGLDSAVITDVQVIGTDYSGQCAPCQPGTYSGPNATMCLPCPVNTISSTTADSCTACSGTKYSLGGIGADKCLDAPECSPQDFWKVYHECNNGLRNVSGAPLFPKHCKEAGPVTTVVEACGSCPATLYWNGSNCVGCPATQHFETSTKSCVDTPAGFANVKHEYFFLPDYMPVLPPNDDGKRAIRDTPPGINLPLPDGWVTGCSGGCGSQGWRTIGDGVDSGYHGSNAVDSFLVYTTTLLSTGRLDFSYDVVGDTSAFSGLQIQVDGASVAITVPYPGQFASISIPLTAGDHSVTFNYHQVEGDNAWVQVRDVQVIGGLTGSAEAVPCAPGTFNSDAGASTCAPCAPGSYSHAQASTCSLCTNNTYSAFPGADHCAPCAEGTSAPTAGAVYCTTKCRFTASNGKQFDLSSAGASIGPVMDRSGLNYYFGVCNVLPDTAACPTSHVCTKDGSNVATNNGLSLEFSLNPNNITTDYFILTYTNGDNARCANPVQTATTVIAFGCDTEVSEAVPRFVDTDSDSCITYFAWRTRLGCPVCTEADYNVVEGGCDGKMKTITKIRNARCNGADTIALDSQACTVPASPAELAAILIAIIFFVLFVAAAIFFYRRNKTLTKKYSMLLEGNHRQSVELHDTVSVAAGR